MPAVATAAAQLVGKAPVSVNVGTSTITIRLAGRVGSVPGASAVAGGAAGTWAAAGLALAALLVLAVQAAITYHRGSARALRIAG